MKLTPPLHKIKLTNEVLKELTQYLVSCAVEAFIGMHGYFRVDPIREELLIFHTKSLMEKVGDKVHKHSHEARSKIVTLQLSHAERVTFSVLFKRMQVPEVLSSIEFLIINKLVIETKK